MESRRPLKLLKNRNNKKINYITKMRKPLVLCLLISLLLLGIRAEDNNDEIIDTLENTNLYSKIGSIKSTLDYTAYPKIRFAYDIS